MTDTVIHIDNISDERVALYTEYNEPQLLHYNEPDGGVSKGTVLFDNF